MEIALLIFLAIVLGFVLKLVVSNIAAGNLNRNIFKKGTKHNCRVIGWYDLEGRRHDDSIQDVIYTGGNSEKDSYSYTQVILQMRDSNGLEKEIVVDTYSKPDEEETLLSSKYLLGTYHNVYEYKGNYRFEADKWIAE